jgi:molecular chaperone DnaK
VSEQQGIFGIDLGTTYSVVAYIDETGRPAVVRNTDGDDTTPSVVYFESASNVVVGKTAKSSAGVFPDEVVSLIKREMGNKDFSRTFHGKEFSPSAISALILGTLAESAQEETGRPVRQVVITVPAYFGLLEKDATKKAGEIAGLDVIGIVPEPVAAALSYGVTGNAAGTTFVVYDLGGGTFDVTLIKMTDTSVEVLAVDGNHKLGGADWDSRLFDYFKDQVIEQSGDDSIEDDEGSLQELRLLAEETKKALSKAESRKVNYRYSGMATTITVTRAQFEEMTADLLEETIRITNRMLEEAEGPGRFPGVRGQISEFLLVGGSSKMPAVMERVRKEYPWEPKVADPDLAVAKGAALYAAGQTVRIVEAGAAGDAPAGDGKRRGSLPSGPVSAEAVASVAADTGLDPDVIEKLADKTIVNVLPKAVGIKLVDTDLPNWQDLPDEQSCYIEHLIPAQTQLPHRAPDFVAGTTVANQQSIEMWIWEQDGEVADRALPANHPVSNAGYIEGIGSFRLPAGSDINIIFDVDAEGIVSLLAIEPVSGKELRMSVKIAIMSEEQVAQEKAVVSAMRKAM